MHIATISQAEEHILLLQAYIDIKSDRHNTAAAIVAQSLIDSGEDTESDPSNFEIINAEFRDDRIIVWATMEDGGPSYRGSHLYLRAQ